MPEQHYESKARGHDQPGGRLRIRLLGYADVVQFEISVAAPLYPPDRRRGSDPDEIEAVLTSVNTGRGSIGGANLHIAFHIGHEEKEIVEGCEEIQFSVRKLEFWFDALRGGSGAEVFCQPGVSILGSLRHIEGGQDCDGGCIHRREQDGEGKEYPHKKAHAIVVKPGAGNSQAG